MIIWYIQHPVSIISLNFNTQYNHLFRLFWTFSYKVDMVQEFEFLLRFNAWGVLCLGATNCLYIFKCMNKFFYFLCFAILSHAIVKEKFLLKKCFNIFIKTSNALTYLLKKCNCLYIFKCLVGTRLQWTLQRLKIACFKCGSLRPHAKLKMPIVE